MKPAILVPIIIGSVLLTTAGVLLAVGIANNSKNNKVTTREVVVEETFNNIDIDFSVTDVELIKASDGKNKIVYSERPKQTHVTEVKDGTLTLRSQDTRKWYEKVFVFNYSKITATIYLADTTYGNIKTDLSTGNVIVPGDFTFENVNLKSSTGDLKFEAKVNNELKVECSTGNTHLKDVTAKSVNLKASTGKETLENVTVTEGLNIAVSTGNIELTGVKSKNLQTTSSTGKTTLTNTVIQEHIQIKASTGDVKFNDSDAQTLKIETSTGDVTGTLLTSKIFYATSSTGKIKVPQSTTGGMCEVKTSTGDIILSIKA